MMRSEHAFIFRLCKYLINNYVGRFFDPYELLPKNKSLYDNHRDTLIA